MKASEEDEAMIKEIQRNAAFRNPNMAAAHLVGAQAQAMQDAAKNEGQGSFAAFTGMNMAGNMGGMNPQVLFNMSQQQTSVHSNNSPNLNSIWVCSCGQENNGKFCSECGNRKPGSSEWACSCGTANTGKFCSECGKQN